MYILYATSPAGSTLQQHYNYIAIEFTTTVQLHDTYITNTLQLHYNYITTTTHHNQHFIYNTQYRWLATSDT